MGLLRWQALLLIGYFPREVDLVRRFMLELDADMVKVQSDGILQFASLRKLVIK